MSTEFPRAGLFKRFAAIVYDWLAVIALAMLATVLNLIIVSTLQSYELLTLPEGLEPSDYLNQAWWVKVELLLVVWMFYAWFWYDGGQTLGMRAWRMKVIPNDDQPLTLKRCMFRAAYALFGFGNLAVWFPPSKKLALQDRLTNTQVVVLTKEANKQVYLRGVEDPNE